MSATLKEYLGQNNTNIDESLKSVIMSIAQGAIIVQNKVSRISLDDISGSTGEINVQGEQVEKLDLIASDVFLKNFAQSEYISAVGVPLTVNPDYNLELAEVVK
mgnify:CR=1 FL=1